MADVGLAKFQEVKPVDYSGLSKGINALAKGYKTQQQREATQLALSDPEEINKQYDTQQTDMLESQTADMGLEGEQAVGEEAAQSSTRKNRTLKDWAQLRADTMNKAADSGMSYDEIMKLEQGITKRQQQAFGSEMKKAYQLAEAGNADGAVKYLNNAYSNYPDGIYANMSAAVDPKTGKPLVVGIGYDELTGETSGTLALTPEQIMEWSEMVLSDDAKWASLTRDRQEAEKLFNARLNKIIAEERKAQKQGDKYEADATAIPEKTEAYVNTQEALARKYDRTGEGNAAKPPRPDTLGEEMSRYKEEVKAWEATPQYEEYNNMGYQLEDAYRYREALANGEMSQLSSDERKAQLRDIDSRIKAFKRRMDAIAERGGRPTMPQGRGSAPQQNSLTAGNMPQGNNSIPPNAKQSEDGNFYTPDGRVLDASGTQIGKWK